MRRRCSLQLQGEREMQQVLQKYQYITNKLLNITPQKTALIVTYCLKMYTLSQKTTLVNIHKWWNSQPNIFQNKVLPYLEYNYSGSNSFISIVLMFSKSGKAKMFEKISNNSNSHSWQSYEY